MSRNGVQRPKSPRVQAAGCLAVLILAASPSAEAVEAEHVPAPPRVVMIAAEADADASAAAIAAVRAQLSDLHVELLVDWVPEFADALRAQYAEMRRVAVEHDAAVAFWVDVSMTEQVFLYVAEPGGGRILVRAVEFTEETGNSRFDVVAIIVRTVVEAIAEGGEIGVRPAVKDLEQPALEPPPPPEPVPVPEPPPPEPPPTEPVPVATGVLELKAAYGGLLYDREPTWLHGARLGIGVAVFDWLWFDAAYRIQQPIERATELVTMELKPHPFEVGIAARLEASAWIFEFGITLLNDPLTWSIRTKQEGIQAEPEKFRWLVAAAPFASIGWSPYGFYRLFVAASADIYFNESPSVVSTANGHIEVIDPLFVRPYLQIGAAFVLL